MTDQEKLWCELFIKTGSLADATEQAGFYSINDDLTQTYFYSRGQVISKMPHIQEYVQKLLRQEALTPNEVIKIISRHARSTMSDYFDLDENDELIFNPRKAMERGAMGNIKKIDIRPTEHGSHVKLELYSAEAAAKTLAQYYDMFSSKMPVDYARQLWVYFTKGLIDLPFLYKELGVDGTHELLDQIPLPERKLIDA